MFDINQFKSLQKEQKISKLISMLEILKESGDLFDNLYELLTTLKDNISNELLDNLYEIIATTVKNLNNLKLKEDIKKIERLKEKIKKLSKIEEKENPDDILDQLNSI